MVFNIGRNCEDLCVFERVSTENRLPPQWCTCRLYDMLLPSVKPCDMRYHHQGAMVLLDIPLGLVHRKIDNIVIPRVIGWLHIKWDFVRVYMIMWAVVP